jgi:hypothetical protein
MGRHRPVVCGGAGVEYAMAGEAEIAGATGVTLLQLEQELAHIKHALGLLGAKPCSVCGRYYLSSHPENLFHAGPELICYGCLSRWWLERCPQLSVTERSGIEHKLLRWLVEHHGAQVFRELRDLPPSELQDIHLVVSCPECGATGKEGGARCQHCLGNRNLWVITPSQHPQPH